MYPYRSLWWIDLIKYIYWCGIPHNCRTCDLLEECRLGFFHLRKCRNGCYYIKRRSKYLARKFYESEREESFNALIEDANRRERELEAKRNSN